MKVIDSLLPLPELGFCKVFAPWMIEAKCKDGVWEPWQLRAVEEFRIGPAAKALHYAQEIFEGLKAFKRVDGSIGLFRPLENIRRMAVSSEILVMPEYPEAEYLASMKALVAKCKSLVPSDPGALYLRPTMIAVGSTLGVAPSSEYLFYVLASPVGGYFGDTSSDAPAAISVWATRDYARACRGGLGTAKTGANYAASLRAVTEAKKRNFHNVLFLDAVERRNFEELSGMNVFVVEGGTLKTPKLGDTILKGVTRDTILKLAVREGLKVEECDLPIERMIEGMKNGKVSEMFACGTGASITAITELGFGDERVSIGGKRVGEIGTKLYRQLIGIQTGRVASPDPAWIVQC